MDTVGHTGDEEEHSSFEERFDHPGKTWASATHRQFSLQAVAVATVNATYSWVESEARRVLRVVLNVREKERRQEVTPPVACTRRARVEVSDDDDDDDDDDDQSWRGRRGVSRGRRGPDGAAPGRAARRTQAETLGAGLPAA